jgi:hypothetical protein
MAMREQAHEQAAERVPNQYVRWRDVGALQQRMQVLDQVECAAWRRCGIARATRCSA